MRQRVQNRLISLAPYNPDPVWPEGYFEVLQKAGVHEDLFLIYANWVRDFFKHNPGRRRRSLGAKEIRVYLHLVEESGNVEEATRLQAREALILYYEKFRGIPLVKRNHHQASPTKKFSPEKIRTTPEKGPMKPKQTTSSDHLDWSALKTAYLTAIRVENYARSTEKTYWHWIQDFIHFHQNRRSSELGAYRR